MMDLTKKIKKNNQRKHIEEIDRKGRIKNNKTIIKIKKKCDGLSLFIKTTQQKCKLYQAEFNNMKYNYFVL